MFNTFVSAVIFEICLTLPAKIRQEFSIFAFAKLRTKIFNLNQIDNLK